MTFDKGNQGRRDRYMCSNTYITQHKNKQTNETRKEFFPREMKTVHFWLQVSELYPIFLFRSIWPLFSCCTKEVLVTQTKQRHEPGPVDHTKRVLKTEVTLLTEVPFFSNSLRSRSTCIKQVNTCTRGWDRTR